MILFLLLLILVIIVVLYKFSNIKEGSPVNTLKYHGPNTYYYIYFKGTSKLLGDKNTDADYKIKTYSFIQADVLKTRWKFLIDPTNQFYYIRNVATGRLLVFKQNNDGNTYLCSYDDTDQTQQNSFIPESSKWTITVESAKLNDIEIPINFKSINSSIKMSSRDIVIQAPSVSYEYITLRRVT